MGTALHCLEGIHSVLSLPVLQYKLLITYLYRLLRSQ
jgi:hypothetical protein